MPAVAKIRAVRAEERPAPVVATTAEGQKAVAALAAAEDALAKCVGAVEVARAKQTEAEAAAPPISARLKEAEEQVETARGKAELAAERTAAAMVTAENKADDLEAAEALLEDRLDGHKDSTPGELVAAQMRVSKASRAKQAADDALIARREAQAATEAALAAAEQARDEAQAGPQVTPAAVVAARVALAEAERKQARAEAEVEAARRVQAAALQVEAQQALNQGSRYASVEEFVTDYLLPSWRHKIDTETRWCATWWRHAEAIARLEHLWEAFEKMRRDPAPAMATWWRDYADPTMRALTSTTGTFAGCATNRADKPDAHQQMEQWHHVTAPDGMFGPLPAAPTQTPEGAVSA